MREVSFSTYINYVNIVEVYEIYLSPINHVVYKLLYIKHALDEDKLFILKYTYIDPIKYNKLYVILMVIAPRHDILIIGCL